jgi:hypothetical protein
MQGTATGLYLSITNPGQTLQIAPPPPALTDDMGVGGFGGAFGGGQVTTILETVGGEISPEPGFPTESDAPRSSIESPTP